MIDCDYECYQIWRNVDMLRLCSRVSYLSWGHHSTWDTFICLRCMSLMIPNHPKCIPPLKSLSNSVYHPSTTTLTCASSMIIRCEIQDIQTILLEQYLYELNFILFHYYFRLRVTTSAWRRLLPRTRCQWMAQRSTLPLLLEKVSRGYTGCQ